MKVKDVMAAKLVTVSPDNSVRRAAGIMLDKHVSGLPVVDDEGLLVGLISEGDLLRRCELGLHNIAAPEQSASLEEKGECLCEEPCLESGRCHELQCGHSQRGSGPIPCGEADGGTRRQAVASDAEREAGEHCKPCRPSARDRNRQA